MARLGLLSIWGLWIFCVILLNSVLLLRREPDLPSMTFDRVTRQGYLVSLVGQALRISGIGAALCCLDLSILLLLILLLFYDIFFQLDILFSLIQMKWVDVHLHIFVGYSVLKFWLLQCLSSPRSCTSCGSSCSRPPLVGRLLLNWDWSLSICRENQTLRTHASFHIVESCVNSLDNWLLFLFEICCCRLCLIILSKQLLIDFLYLTANLWLLVLGSS